MPLTEIQKRILKLLTGHRSEASHLAGATGLGLSPESPRFSHDLDYFHDREAAVAAAFARDKSALEDNGYDVEILLSQPGFIRVVVSDGESSIRIDWAHGSSWRFMPTSCLDEVGHVLHPVDLAINKVLALAGRDEPRDFIDTLFVHRRVLSLGALVWAASGKDPGMSPSMLLELLKRKGKLREEHLRYLDIVPELDIRSLRREWQVALHQAEEFIASRPYNEAGCLYVDPETTAFIEPKPGQPAKLHRATQGGILPAIEGLESGYWDKLSESFFGPK